MPSSRSSRSVGTSCKQVGQAGCGKGLLSNLQCDVKIIMIQSRWVRWTTMAGCQQCDVTERKSRTDNMDPHWCHQEGPAARTPGHTATRDIQRGRSMHTCAAVHFTKLLEAYLIFRRCVPATDSGSVCAPTSLMGHSINGSFKGLQCQWRRTTSTP